MILAYKTYGLGMPSPYVYVLWMLNIFILASCRCWGIVNKAYRVAATALSRLCRVRAVRRCRA
jgi:hypothetical protein